MGFYVMKNINIQAMLTGLDSNELKAFKKLFNTQFSESMDSLREAEVLELKTFIDNLNLDRRYNTEVRNVVSLERYRLPHEQRRELTLISETIGKAFRDLEELKLRVAIEAKRGNVPFSQVFRSSMKRMKRFKEGHHFGW